MKLPMVQRMVQKMSEPLILSASISRNFTGLLASMMQYYPVPTWTATGDFEIEFDIEGGAGTFGRILGNASSFDNEVRINSSNTSLSFKFGGGSSKTISFNSALDRANLNNIVLKRVGTAITLIVNGVLQTDTDIDSGAASFDVFGRSFGSYNDGIISNGRLTDTAGGDNRFYPIDETFASSTTIADTVGGQDGTAVNISSADSQTYLFNGSVSPNTWTNQNPPFDVIEVAGT